MKLHACPFLAPPPEYCTFENARVVVVPFPYEGGVSYGKGAAQAPAAVLNASTQVEYYDIELAAEPYKIGIATLEEPDLPDDPVQMLTVLERISDELLDNGKFPVVVGGDHSISSGFFKSLIKQSKTIGVVQLDAHADLRDSYEGSAQSHASVMARLREMTPHTLQIGIRSMAVEEAALINAENLSVCTMHQWRHGRFDLQKALETLPDKVFITLDVDVFDWSVIAGTGTPEPGGLGWYETLDLLNTIFTAKEVVGFDVVELACSPDDINSPFAVAKLIYKMIGFKFARQLERL